MLEELAERIQQAKDKQFLLMERFHIGDTVYPFWLKNFLVYGTVIDIDTVARKIICDFNGVRRQFCPEDLMLVNPNFVNVNASKSKKASVNNEEYSHYAETHLSHDTENGIKAICKQCEGQVAVSYNEKTGKSDFVCTSCGKRISEDNLSKKSKKAMRKIIASEVEYEQKRYIVKHVLEKLKSILLSVKKIERGERSEKNILLKKTDALYKFVKKWL